MRSAIKTSSQPSEGSALPGMGSKKELVRSKEDVLRGEWLAVESRGK